MTTAVQDMTDEQKKLLRQDFSGAVNMSPNELEDWLATDESTSVGDSDSRHGGFPCTQAAAIADYLAHVLVQLLNLKSKSCSNEWAHRFYHPSP
mgnify:CR=1 FL=1